MKYEKSFLFFVEFSGPFRIILYINYENTKYQLINKPFQIYKSFSEFVIILGRCYFSPFF